VSIEPTAVLVDGPWVHRDVSANGTRLHVAECAPRVGPPDGSSAPLVLFVHGFPEFWWSWRHQLEALSEAGFRTVACDLRGYGASDKPPRGYDVFTLAEDIAGLIRALGEQDAVLVGHDWGGFLAWVTATLRPDVVRRLAVLSIPHPLAFRSALLPGRGGGARGQSRASSYILGFQMPWRPERRLVADDGALVGSILRRWGGPGFPDRETERRNREAMQIPGVAHCSMEYYRWAIRSQFRPDGLRMVRALTPPVTVPTLQIHGAQDPCILPAAARRSRRHVAAPYEWRMLESVGHFPHEEAPRAVNELLTSWAAG
jgi:pimeloyl-ACP methyl ester carboxylesterase